MDVLDALAICAGNALGVLLVHGASTLWRGIRAIAAGPVVLLL